MIIVSLFNFPMKNNVGYICICISSTCVSFYDIPIFFQFWIGSFSYGWILMSCAYLERSSGMSFWNIFLLVWGLSFQFLLSFVEPMFYINSLILSKSSLRSFSFKCHDLLFVSKHHKSRSCRSASTFFL